MLHVLSGHVFADVAVKILTDVGGGSSRVSGGDANFSTATWDKVRLEKLLHEVSNTVPPCCGVRCV